MKKLLSKNWILFLLVGIWISSCTSPEAGGPQTSNTNDTIPVEGDWVRVYHPSDPDGLHPYGTRLAFANYIKEHIFMYLCDLNPKTLELEPTLATDNCVISDDGMKYTYEFIPEAKWDDGSPITGADYEFSMKCILNPLGEVDHIRTYYLDFIQDVSIDPENPRRFTVTIKQPFFLAETAIAVVDIVQRDFYDPNHLLDGIPVPQFAADDEALRNNENLKKFSEEFSPTLIGRDPKMISGSGPYKVENITTGDNITLVRKKDWWGTKLRGKASYFHAYPEKIIYKTITDRSTLPAVARAEELDVVRDMTPQDFTAARQDTSGYLYKHYNFFTPPSYAYICLGFNTRPSAGRAPMLEDKMVRKAISHLVDIEKIINDVYDGSGVRQNGPISFLNKNEYNSEIPDLKFDPALSKQLLDEAGWLDSDGDGYRDKVLKGKKVKLSFEVIISNTSETGPKMMRIIADEAKKAGVEIIPTPIDFGTLSKRLGEHDFDMYGLGFQSSPLPSDLMQQWHSESWRNSGSNYSGFGTPESDSLIAQIRSTPTSEARKPLYWRFQEIMQEEVPVIFLMAPTERIMIHKRFKTAQGYSVRPGYKVSEFWAPKEEQKFK